ncbi:MAG: A24 family peptidase [bacterium]|nr:A24 family peptidase [bacterium]
MTLETFDIIIYCFVFVFGIILGSFLNSWIWRTRENVRIVSGFSICVHCRRQLIWYEKFPLFSFLFLHGQCRTCKKKIPMHYFLVELLTGLLLTAIIYFHNNYLAFSEWWILRDVFFLTLLTVIFFFDYFYQEVLPRIVWPGAIIGFLINLFPLNYSLSSLLWGMIFGGGIFAIQYYISKGRWIGGGDVRLGIMMGAWLGWPNILVAIFIAYILGAIVGLGMMLAKQADRKTAIPFGTFLAVGTFVTMYFGTNIINWYLSFLP